MSQTLTPPVEQIVELRCDRRKHGELVINQEEMTSSRGQIQIHCRYCSHDEGQRVVHVWDSATGERRDDY